MQSVPDGLDANKVPIVIVDAEDGLRFVEFDEVFYIAAVEGSGERFIHLGGLGYTHEQM